MTAHLDLRGSFGAGKKELRKLKPQKQTDVELHKKHHVKDYLAFRKHKTNLILSPKI